MRIHGDKIITRRRSVENRSSYREYLNILKEDFASICGYCGKSEYITKNTFEIDHFIPQKYAPELKNDYSNLVYSCYECNRKKSSKWPSENKCIQLIDGQGFIDPATREYDKHLERDEEGNIIGKTTVGQYMVRIGFEFDKRPMREVYKAMLLIEKKRQLCQKMESVSVDELQKYIETDKLLEQVQLILFSKKE